MSGAPTSDLSGWVTSPFSAAGRTHDCYRKGEGPGVVLVPEIPGMTPEVLGLADRLVTAGFTVVVPSLFGVPGRPGSVPYTLATVARVCVAAEFRAFARDARRPVADYLRALAADVNARTPGPGVGVVGMCFTGGFALAAAVDPTVRASVMSQPAVPFPLSPSHRRDPGLSESELGAVAERAAAGDVCVKALRFSEDRAVPRARLDALQARLGDAFEVIELDSRPGNPDGYAKGAHSVLTGEVRENPPNTAHAVRERIVAFLQERLAGSTS